MNILITGGTGFIGRSLIPLLMDRECAITVLSRQHEETVQRLCGAVQVIHTLESIDSQSHFDAIINLAGEPIANARWSDKRKRLLESSRWQVTQDLVGVMRRLNHTPSVFLSGSAVGFYGAQDPQVVVDETTVPNSEYTHDLCAKWEAAAMSAMDTSRVCILRTGLVIGADGGFLSRMIPAFKMGLGGPLSNGEQMMPWIHLDDMIESIWFLLTHSDAQGPYNLVAPTPVSNEAFSKTLASQLNRPAWIRTPGFVLKSLLGEMSRLLLTGQKAIPARLQKQGYTFRYDTLDAALKAVLSS